MREMYQRFEHFRDATMRASLALDGAYIDSACWASYVCGNAPMDVTIVYQSHGISMRDVLEQKMDEWEAVVGGHLAPLTDQVTFRYYQQAELERLRAEPSIFFLNGLDLSRPDEGETE